MRGRVLAHYDFLGFCLAFVFFANSLKRFVSLRDCSRFPNRLKIRW